MAGATLGHTMIIFSIMTCRANVRRVTRHHDLAGGTGDPSSHNLFLTDAG
jgi:hypothetical protein